MEFKPYKKILPEMRGGWLKSKNGKSEHQITGIDSVNNQIYFALSWHSLGYTFEFFQWIDDKPFGEVEL